MLKAPPLSRTATAAPSTQTQSNTADSAPILLVEVDIARPIPCVLFIDLETRQRYTRGLLLVRMYDQPIGLIEVAADDFQITSEQVAGIIWNRLHVSINQRLKQDNMTPIEQLDAFGLPHSGMPGHLRERYMLRENAPMMSIVVCTHERPEQLARCLDSLEQVNYPGFEIIVVDNTPKTDATKTLIEEHYPDVYYLRENAPGLSNARNRGLMAAVGEIVAFTDDDAIVDTHWLSEILRGFHAADDVVAVTGLTLPAELETPSQVWLQRQYGAEARFDRHVFTPQQQTRKESLVPTQSTFGAGMNMAFKRAFLMEIGGFDPALGIGSMTHSGEDLAAYFEGLSRGHQIAYEPGAIVYHTNRESYSDLRDKIFGRSVGFTAHLTRACMSKPTMCLSLLLGLPYILSVIFGSSQTNRSSKYPLAFRFLEIIGVIYGPLAYLRSRRNNQRTIYQHRL